MQIKAVCIHNNVYKLSPVIKNTFNIYFILILDFKLNYFFIGQDQSFRRFFFKLLAETFA